MKLQAASTQISSLQVSLSATIVRLKITYLKAKDESKGWGIWQGHMKKIGGHFGNGVLSYFTFLRWLLYLNIATGLLTFTFITMPTLAFKPTICMRRSGNETIDSNTYINNSTANATLQFYRQKSCESDDPHTKNYVFNKNSVQNVIDFFQGTGWTNTTVMFYGRYDNSFLQAFNDWTYNLPLAYLMTSLGYFLLCLYLMISTAVKTFEDGYIKGGESNAFSFSNTLFGSWDMCITNEETANLTSASIAMELEAAVEDSRRESEKESRTKKEIYKIKAVRVLVNVIVLLCLFGGGFAIYKAVKWSMDQGKVTKATEQNFRTMLINYASQITITAVNTMLPTLFYKLSEFEKMNPRRKLNMDLARTVLVKLASICVLVVSIFQRNKSDKVICWENLLGAEMYKLIWMDFFVSLFVTFFIEYPRGYIGRNVDSGCKLNEKIGVPEFHIPNNVLTLIYNQTIIWIGVFYSPLMPMMNCLKLIIQFYIRKASLMKNYDPPKKQYRAGKSNYFFMVLELIAFALSLVATVYAVTQVTPSFEHGPFRGFEKMYDVILLAIADLPDIYKYVIYMIFSPVVLMSVFLLLCLAAYFFHAMYRAYSKSASNLQKRLQVEQQEKKKLLKELAGSRSKQKCFDLAEDGQNIHEYIELEDIDQPEDSKSENAGEEDSGKH
eukprot:gene15139-6326_t